MNARQQLEAARELQRAGLSKEYYARDTNGEPLPVDEGPREGAVCYCPVGALAAAAGGLDRVEWPASDALYEAAYKVTGRRSVTSYADAPTTTVDDCVRLFDLALTLLPEATS